jgi:hypothetical protein
MKYVRNVVMQFNYDIQRRLSADTSSLRMFRHQSSTAACFALCMLLLAWHAESKEEKGDSCNDAEVGRDEARQSLAPKQQQPGMYAW